MHFYMETQSTLVVPEDPGIYTVWASTQDPASAQHAVAAALEKRQGISGIAEKSARPSES